MHEGKCLSQLDKHKFTLLETFYNADKWRHREHFWSTPGDCISSYLEVILGFFLFHCNNRLYYGQHTSSTFFFRCLWYHLALSVEKVVGSAPCILDFSTATYRFELACTGYGYYFACLKKTPQIPCFLTKDTNTTLNTTAMCSLLSLPHCYLWHRQSTGGCSAVYHRERILCK